MYLANETVMRHLIPFMRRISIVRLGADMAYTAHAATGSRTPRAFITAAIVAKEGLPVSDTAL